LQQLSVRAPETPEDWTSYYALRWRILRAPWGQPPGSERDGLENSSVHRMVCDTSGKVLAVGRLHDTDNQTAQIRYMAVETGCEGQGLGTRILEQLEQAALARGTTTVVLHARESALPFYRRRGYRDLGPSHLLFGTIQHYLMSKQLCPTAAMPDRPR
jgi:predicted GNAT family N-acyltransferase